MTIALYVNCLSNGGAERVAARLTELWHSLGHEVVIFTMNPPGTTEYAHCCFARDCVPYNQITDKRATELRQKYRFDLLVFNDSINDIDFVQAYNGFRSVNDLKIAVLIHHTSNNWLYTLGNTQELGMEALMSKADAVVCVDKMWALWWHHRGARSFFIQNPVAIASRQSLDDGNIIDHKQIIWVGRLKDWAKQPEKAITAFVEINRRLPDTRLVMLGATTPDAEKALMRNVPCELREKIELKGFVPNAADYMRSAALHIFTSLTEVTVPQVVLEAQALGLPTIALDMPVVKGTLGVSIVRDVHEMAERAVELLTDERKRLELVTEAKKAQGSSDNEIDAKWRMVFDAISAKGEDSCRRLDALQTNMMREWRTEEEYGKLLDEIHRSNSFFVNRYLPDVHFVHRWRNRLNMSTLWIRIKARIP